MLLCKKHVMEEIIQDLKNYLQETLGIHLELKAWKGAVSLPFFLQELYYFYTGLILGKKSIFAVAREGSRVTPGTVSKHFAQLQAQTEMACIYVSKDISFYDRKRLIQHGVQFVTPRRQVYFPDVGVDWQQKSRGYRLKDEVCKIMPSTQAVAIYIITHPEKKQFNPHELAKALNYTRMTMTRALNELEIIGFGQTIRRGKERWFNVKEECSLLWVRIEPYLNLKEGKEERVEMALEKALGLKQANFKDLITNLRQVYGVSLPS